MHLKQIICKVTGMHLTTELVLTLMMNYLVYFTWSKNTGWTKTDITNH